MIWIAVAAAGAAGAASRYALDLLIAARLTTLLPLGTLAVNISGSFAVGAVAGAAAGQARLLIAGGFLGAYTTFSTATYETVRLVEERALGMAVANLMGALVVAVAATAAGWTLTGG